MDTNTEPKTDRIVVPTLNDTIHNANSSISNGLAQAVGMSPGIGGGFNPWGAQGFGGPTISDTTTAFENLRWYLVSNFRQLLSELFVEIGLVKTVCCVPVMDGLRGGVMFKSKQLDEQQLIDLKLEMDRQDDINIAGWGSIWQRLYGGSGILILVSDQDPEMPLDIAAISPDSEVLFRAADMWELFWDKQNVEGYDVEIQDEDLEYYNYYAETLHASRVMKLKGLEAPSFIRPRLRGWGLSEVESLIRSMNQYLKATDLGFEVLDEFKLDVYKIKNLVSTLMSPNGTQKIKERIQTANWQKNYQHAVVMDSEDDFDHKQLSFAGLAEAMAGIRQQVAADMRMPQIKLFGQSFSSGLGSSAPEEMENYNSMIESDVRSKLKWHILKMGEIRCQQMFGMIPDDLEIEFKPLRELTAEQQENVKEKKFNRIAAAKAAGELTTQEYRDSCNKGSLFDIQLDTVGDSTEDEQLGDVLSGEAAGEDDGGEQDSEDIEPGADQEDSQKSEPKLKVVNKYSLIERAVRVANSADFDRASYEADGGDEWIQDGRRGLFERDNALDKSLFDRCEHESQSLYDRNNWKFVVWLYKKLGGRFL